MAGTPAATRSSSPTPCPETLTANGHDLANRGTRWRWPWSGTVSPRRAAGVGRLRPTGRHESRSVPRARPRLGPPPARRAARMPARPGDCAPGQSATTPAVPTRRATVSPALSAQSTTTASWPGSRSRPDRSSDRSDHARRDGGTRTRPRRTGDGRREGDLRDDQAHLRRSIWASRMRPTCGLVIGAPSVPDWATSNGLARPRLPSEAAGSVRDPLPSRRSTSSRSRSETS